ncbi:hypothetical protein [Clostridium beijerinckii]|uniref:hypothetical protein n=1 Tax=Clostridium beijerinckii TaxID=1520 RepID=UPI00156FFDC8|nr:hypothetical protein [Clostridium beijerinckii]NRU52551.1 hypothetical protein [Clostridium beijerinckii]NYC69272.1 hypothetical protein [Clostridium beijerinckii]NYC91752.1 hypothetical protein [Clostridium beijerinckii]
MKLGYIPSMLNNVRTMKVYIKSLGSTTLTEADEQKIIDDYSPLLQYKDLIFSGKFNIDPQGNVIVDETNGELVTLSLVNQVLNINKDFIATFSIATKDIKDSELGANILKTKDLVAEAKCLLFKNIITKAVEDIITAIKGKENNFETESESVEF